MANPRALPKEAAGVASRNENEPNAGCLAVVSNEGERLAVRRKSKALVTLWVFGKSELALFKRLHVH